MTPRRLTWLVVASTTSALFACEGALSFVEDGGRDTGSFDTGSFDTGVEEDAQTPTHDAAGVDASSADRAGVFVAQGYAGRIAVSCDDGLTWRFDREDSLTDPSGAPLPPVERCFDGVDCDHHPGRAKGVVFHHGWFVRTNGWGPPGAVRRSRNGIAWEVIDEGRTFGGIATSSDGSSPGILVLGARTPLWSDDDGETFHEATNEAISGWNVRRVGLAAGRFVVVGNDGNEVGVSTDGTRWTTPSHIDPECGRGIQNEGGIAGIGEALVIVSGTGVVCRSVDGGTTWTTSSLPEGARPSSSDVVTTGTELMVWSDGMVFRSSDGATWRGVPTEPRIQVGAVARSPAGTFVAVRGGWDQWNESQRFYRSADGVRWDELPPEAARRSHPIGWIAWGLVERSRACVE
ncbi:MAG: hypothetical protein OHK0013_16920 [Sandaracinaceae bacterium]